MLTKLSGALTRVRRHLAPVLVVAALVIATAIAVPLAVNASSKSVSVAAGPSPSPAKPVTMGSYPASKYADAASQLPATLGAALKRDLGISSAEYLADADASAQAVKVVAALKSAGVKVLGSKITGTQLTVNVASSAESAAVEAVGATPVVGAPVVHDYSKTEFHSVA
ncbi:MAG: hypothetical protein JWM16_6268 [Verrucomicrobiales bacterium]|nr:hypothetical protein [Verrucomicrobiales bacterium]